MEGRTPFYKNMKKNQEAPHFFVICFTITSLFLRIFDNRSQCINVSGHVLSHIGALNYMQHNE